MINSSRHVVAVGQTEWSQWTEIALQEWKGKKNWLGINVIERCSTTMHMINMPDHGYRDYYAYSGRWRRSSHARDESWWVGDPVILSVYATSAPPTTHQPFFWTWSSESSQTSENVCCFLQQAGSPWMREELAGEATWTAWQPVDDFWTRTTTL